VSITEAMRNEFAEKTTYSPRWEYIFTFSDVIRQTKVGKVASLEF
jgi:hypothetical protein